MTPALIDELTALVNAGLEGAHQAHVQWADDLKAEILRRE